MSTTTQIKATNNIIAEKAKSISDISGNKDFIIDATQETQKSNTIAIFFTILFKPLIKLLLTI